MNSFPALCLPIDRYFDSEFPLAGVVHIEERTPASGLSDATQSIARSAATSGNRVYYAVPVGMRMSDLPIIQAMPEAPRKKILLQEVMDLYGLHAVLDKVVKNKGLLVVDGITRVGLQKMPIIGPMEWELEYFRKATRELAYFMEKLQERAHGRSFPSLITSRTSDWFHQTPDDCSCGIHDCYSLIANFADYSFLFERDHELEVRPHPIGVIELRRNIREISPDTFPREAFSAYTDGPSME